MPDSSPTQGLQSDKDQEVERVDISTEEVIRLLRQLLDAPKLPLDEKLQAACDRYVDLDKLVETIIELRTVAKSLSKGTLDEPISSRGYVMSNIKALQANLHHLVWQLTQVSKGDFSQRIDFLGDFSESFNAMCEKLEGKTLRLVEQARIDSLTQLANRMHLDEYLEELFEDLQEGKMEFSLMMVDIDHFKRVNDVYGHDVGDIVLQYVADCLRKVFRTSDFISRFGGEEFVVVLPMVPLERARVIAQRVLDHLVENPIVIDETTSLNITASVGVTEALPTDESASQIIKRSDMVLYLAKNKGRNRVECS